MGKNILSKIKVIPLKIIKVKTGNVMHILKKNQLKNWNFAEAYFSKIKFNKIKSWKYHKKMILNLTVPIGKVQFVFYCKTSKKFKSIKIGEKSYKRLVVPSKVWFGFKGLARSESLILNLANLKHDLKEVITCKKNKIKYNW
jgi:dTDP-4-dehydrorhamnose 3,5-epimerase